jgi:hypothetical protein
VVWLGALILAASIVGCVVTIVLAWRFPDPPVGVDGGKTTSIPQRHSADSTPATREVR